MLSLLGARAGLLTGIVAALRPIPPLLSGCASSSWRPLTNETPASDQTSNEKSPLPHRSPASPVGFRVYNNPSALLAAGETLPLHPDPYTPTPTP